ncbi:MAG: HAMP domain-containing histidine kinase [Armatimonadetes bacterium]|nr:HAMP domain-containing histidine kinase [Armatimonadota bacterium]
MHKGTKQQETRVNQQCVSVVKLAETGDMEPAMQAILRLPDKLASLKDAAEIDYRYLGEFIAGLDAPTPVASTVFQLLAGLCLYRAGDVAGSLGHFQQAQREARHVEDEHRRAFLKVAGACGESWALMRNKESPAAVRRARAAVAVAETAASTWLMAHARHALGRVFATDPQQRHRTLGLLNEARSEYLAPDVDDLRGAAYCLQVAGRLQADEGDLDHGLTDLHESLALMRRTKGDRGAASVLLDTGWIRAYQQSFVLARELGREAISILDTRNDYRGLAKAHHLVGWAYLCEGQNHEAEASFLRSRDYCREARAPAVGVFCTYYLARCAFAMGKDEDCARHLRQCRRRRGYDAMVDLSVRALEAARAIRRHQWSKAADMIHHLTGDLRTAGVRRVEADALFLCGFEWCKVDHLEDAAPLLRRALEVAADAQAAYTLQRFLAANESAALHRWMATLVATLVDRARVEQQLADQAVAAQYAFHDLKNAFFRIGAALELYDELPEEANIRDIAQDANDCAEVAGELQEAFGCGDGLLKPRLEPFAPAQFIEDRARGGRANPAGRLTYETDIEPDLPMLMADPRAMARVFGNLASNAQKYAPGSTITLSAKAHQDASGEIVGVVLGFADDGPGIHPQDLEVIFTPRKHPSQYRVKRKNHGSGIGLGYCRVIAEAHGGRIWAQSELGHGAAFYVELPVPKATGK